MFWAGENRDGAAYVKPDCEGRMVSYFHKKHVLLSQIIYFTLQVNTLLKYGAKHISIFYTHNFHIYKCSTFVPVCQPDSSLQTSVTITVKGRCYNATDLG